MCERRLLAGIAFTGQVLQLSVSGTRKVSEELDSAHEDVLMYMSSALLSTENCINMLS
jgi:hypothetical protein